jgi:hypothetical protein
MTNCICNATCEEECFCGLYDDELDGDDEDESRNTGRALQD